MTYILTMILGLMRAGGMLWLVGSVSSDGSAKGDQALSAGFNRLCWLGFLVFAKVIGRDGLDKIGLLA